MMDMNGMGGGESEDQGEMEMCPTCKGKGEIPAQEAEAEQEGGSPEVVAALVNAMMRGKGGRGGA